MEVVHGIAIPRQDMQTSHEEADLIMVQQAYKSVVNTRSNVVSIISDGTYFFFSSVTFIGDWH